ncbi:glycosyltransferase family 4 protein [Candidatus Peregrinibacteria bacterium]|nr:glycosyltransferase family 4 protein [Candidatus Peregrinibacteria bacterium]
MKIGIDARLYSSAFTGIGRYVYELIDHLIKIDRHNHYVLFFNQPEFEKFHVPRLGLVEKILADAPHYSFAEQWRFCNILRRAKLDLMHFTHFNAPFFYRKPSIVTIHDLTLSLYPGEKMKQWWHRFGYQLTIRSIVRRSKRVIAVSEHTKRDIVRMLHVDPEKISVIHEGVNPRFHQITDRHIIDEFLQKSGLTKPYILYTGVWRSHKNLVNLIKAFAILKHAHHFDGWLVITGKEDPWYPEVKQTVQSEGLEGEVRFTGLIPDEDLVLLYNGALIYVLPSFYEGFGLPALEAFACGIPVCAARSSSLPEVCGEGNAVFFDPHKPADIASKIASVLSDPTQMENLRRKGFARLKDFSWEKMARETLEVYNKIQ